VEFMKTKIDLWVKKGGHEEKLWESVRNAERREGVVVCVNPPKCEASVDNEDAKPIVRKGMRVERDVEKLHRQLDQVMHQREKLKKEMDVVVWRARLVELATERSEKVDECAWDQRICFGDEEYAEFGIEVLASYEDNAEKEEVKNEGEDAMQVDTVTAEDGAWWCRGKKKCERHSG
jgi:COMPASS component SPP1